MGINLQVKEKILEYDFYSTKKETKTNRKFCKRTEISESNKSQQRSFLFCEEVFSCK